MKWLLPILLFGLSTNVLAYDDDESFLSYEQIVRELSTQGGTTRAKRPTTYADPLSQVMIHGGVSFVNSYVNLSPENTSPISGFHGGIEATIGIDLFSRYWIAEGSVRSFGANKIEENEVSLREFDLKIVYKDLLVPKIYYRMGLGMAARYLKFKETVDTNVQPSNVETSAIQTITKEYTTPSSIIFVGMGGDFGKNFSLGVEVSYRGAMIDETIDKNSLDASLRLDAHF